MNRTEKLLAFNYACSQALVELRQTAGRVVSGYGSECRPDVLLEIFLDSMEANLDAIPDYIEGSCQDMQDYLLERLGTNNWRPPETTNDESLYEGIFKIQDLEGSGFGIEGPRGSHPRVVYNGLPLNDDEDLVHIPVGCGPLGSELVLIPVSVDYVEELAEEAPRA